MPSNSSPRYANIECAMTVADTGVNKIGAKIVRLRRSDRDVVFHQLDVQRVLVRRIIRPAAQSPLRVDAIKMAPKRNQARMNRGESFGLKLGGGIARNPSHRATDRAVKRDGAMFGGKRLRRRRG